MQFWQRQSCYLGKYRNGKVQQFQQESDLLTLLLRDGWTSLMHGISTVRYTDWPETIRLTWQQVTKSMNAWKDTSLFLNFIEDNPAFFSPQSMPATSVAFDDDSLYQAIDALHRLSARLPNVHPLAQRLHEIITFAQDFQSGSTSMQSKQLFEKLQPIRAWLFWMPVNLVKANDMGSLAMVLLAQLYTLSLAIDFSIPELKGAALGSLTVQAIEQMDTKLRYQQAITIGIEMNSSDLDELMQSSRMTAARSQRASQSISAQIKLEDMEGQAGAQAMTQHSPYNFRPLSIGSQPGTPNYPPPGTPGFSSTPPMLPTHSFEDLSHPPSPFLRYDSPVSPQRSHLEASPRPHSLCFDNRSLSGYEYSLEGDSPAYSPAAYSPGFIPDPEEEAWAFGGNSPYSGGFVPQHLWT